MAPPKALRSPPSGGLSLSGERVVNQLGSFEHRIESMTRQADTAEVVIIGGGFAGIYAAQALRRAPVHVTVIDRRNHHLFQPLLYQVATAGLNPSDIAYPIRSVLRRQKNVRVLLGEVQRIDTAARRVELDDGSIAYDHLIVATGATHSYFNHPEWAELAPGLKTIEDALDIRGRIFLAYEEAERTTDPIQQAECLTFVVVGGGPTGVEMAGAIADLARFALARDFRNISASMARVVLVEAGPRILQAFPVSLADHARAVLEKRGVTVLTDTSVKEIAPGRVSLDGREIAGATIIWGAGVKASPVGEWLGVPVDRIGRVSVEPDLSLAAVPDVYVIGDAAAFAVDGTPLPALAQVAEQEGKHLGRALRANLLRGTTMPPFRFFDRGNTAVISSGAAVYDFRGWHLRGFIGWVFWAVIHVYLLTGFRNRILVATQWLWRLATFEPGARIITVNDDPEEPRG
jgi:NADH dehydrogenase